MPAPPINASPNMYCRHCGYALVGLPSNRCPECGHDFDPTDPRTFLARPRRVVLRRIIKIALVFLCLSLPADVYFGYLDWQVHRESKAIQILRANGVQVTTYDTTPRWAKVVFFGRAAWLWQRADGVYTPFESRGGGWPSPPPKPVSLQWENATQYIAVVANLKSLRAFSFCGEENSVTDNDLAQLKGLTALQMLDIPGTLLTDAGLAQLQGLTALEYLNLAGTRITDAGLAHLKGFTALQCLDLENTQISDAGLAQLKGFTALRRLYLENTQISDTGLAQLQYLTNLQNLCLSHTKVTDAGLVHLQGLTALQVLDLGDIQVTDAGLEQLKGLAALRAIGLGGHTRVTPAGEADFKKTHPACQIDRY